MLVFWMIWYCYCFLSGFKWTFQLYSSAFSISWYGDKCHVPLCIGQQHPITVYRTGFGVCVVLVLSVIRYSWYYILDRILFHHDFHHDSCDCNWAILCFLNYILGFLQLCSSGSANARLPGRFRPWTFSWILDRTCYLRTPLCHVYNPNYDIIQGVPGFAIDCPWCVCCRGLTTCLLYVGPFFWKSNLKW